MTLIQIGETNRKGRGIFARRVIPVGTVIEEAAVRVLPQGDLTGTGLDEYRFVWDGGREAVAFGALSFANHSDDPNAWLEMDPAAELMRLIARRDIPMGEEITVDYGCELWFQPAG